MSLRMAGAGSPADIGNIKRWVEGRIIPNGLTDGAVEPLSLTGLVRFGGGTAMTTGTTIIGQVSANQAINRFKDQRRCLKFTPTVANNSICWFAMNGGAVAQSAFVDFQPTPLVSLADFAAPDGADFRDPSWSVSAWCVKDAAGDASHCQHFLGFANTSVLGGATAEIPRVGLVGDGVTGYRFGSVNAPDGLAAGNNGASDIDAGSVQPASLVNPGTNWFHVRVKMVPPGPGQVGQVACYLNGVRVVTFSALANLPRGHQGVNDNFTRINAGVGTYADAGGVRPSLVYHDLRLRIEDDWSI